MVSMLLFEYPQEKLTKQAFHEETKSMLQPFPKWPYLIMPSFRELDFNIQSLRDRAYRYSDHSITVSYPHPHPHHMPFSNANYIHSIRVTPESKPFHHQF